MSRPCQHLLACLLFGIVAAVGATESQNDESAIRDVQVRQARAWNSHDAGEYASLFTEDGDVVNVLGWWWKGRPEIKAKLSDAFAWVFRDSTLTIDDVQVRFLDPSTAVLHVLWTLDGAKVPPGAPAPPRQGIQVQIMRKSDGRWMIASFQNTNSVPETPFPRAPVPPPGARSPP